MASVPDQASMHTVQAARNVKVIAAWPARAFAQ
jgi:hypothetical protein